MVFGGCGNCGSTGETCGFFPQDFLTGMKGYCHNCHQYARISGKKGINGNVTHRMPVT